MVVFIYVVSLNPNEEEYNTLPSILILLVLSIFLSKTTHLINTNNFIIRYFLSQTSLILIMSFIGLIISSSSKLILSPLKTLKTTSYEKKYKIPPPNYQINIQYTSRLTFSILNLIYVKLRINIRTNINSSNYLRNSLSIPLYIRHQHCIPLNYPHYTKYF